MTQTIFPFETEFAFWQTAKDDVLLAIKESLETYEFCRIGLAGGSTPKTLYSLLAEEKLPWEKIIWVQLDERYVPSDDHESNLKMMRQALFSKAPVPPQNIIAFDTSLPQLSAAKEMSRQLIQLTNERFPLFDLLILGAGSDGHIASLFEGDSSLDPSHYASIAHAKGYPTPQRLTSTLMALKSAERALLLLKGESKQALVTKLQSGEDCAALSQIIEAVPTKILTNVQ